MLHLAIYFIIFFREKYTIGTDINAIVLCILIEITDYIIAMLMTSLEFRIVLVLPTYASLKKSVIDYKEAI